jgi:hypothetical protein
MDGDGATSITARNKKAKVPQNSADAYSNYMKRNIALI